MKWDTGWNYSDRLVFNQGYIYEYNSFAREDNVTYQDGYSGSIVTHQVYGQPELYLTDSLILTTGFNLSSFQVNDRKQNVDLSAGVFYSFASNIRTSLTYSRNNRYPILQELFSSSSGNPDLLPEKADKFEVTAGIPLNLGNRGAYLHIALFRNDIFNLIEPKFNPEDGSRLYHNVEKADNYGTDIDITHNPWNFWLTNLSYSLILSGRKSDYSLLRMPRHSFVFSNEVKLTDNLSLNQESEFYSERDDLDNTDNQQMLDSYNLHNISLSYKFRAAIVSCGIDNVFDTLYYERFGFPGRGRNLFFSLELRV
jgi:outer membrane receptor protein involved in Fe transport